MSAPAFATQHRHADLAGVLVAASALGSLLGGLAYGARSWAASATHRLISCTAAVGALLVLPALARTPAAAAAGLVIAGAPMGATLTTGYLLAGELLPEDRTAVGFSILTLAINGGAAAGAALAAQIASRASASGGFLFGAAAAGVAALAAVSLHADRSAAHDVGLRS